MDQQQIGQFIQARRKALGLTQQALGEQLGVTNKAVSKWEKGHSMPDVSLFEPLCQTLEISIPELLAGHPIAEADRRQAAEQLLVESISTKKLIGLEVFLYYNILIGILLAISPLLFRPARPLNVLLVLFGLIECALVVYFDAVLPGKTARRQSLAVRFVYTIGLFVTLAAINYPAAMREGVPVLQWLLVFLAPCVLSLLAQWLIWHRRRNSQ